MAKDNLSKGIIQDILGVLSAFNEGTFSSRLKEHNDPALQPIVDSLHQLSKTLAAQAQPELNLSDQAFQNSILNLVDYSIAVLDRSGTIVAVNESWVRFSKEIGQGTGSTHGNTGVGANYLSVCASGEAKQIGEGILRVINGELHQFIAEYPCHSPTEQRWFQITVSPFPKLKGGVVISHTNITERRQLALAVTNNELLISSVLNALPIAVFGKDIKNDFQWNIWNKGKRLFYRFKIQVQASLLKFRQDCLSLFSQQSP